jgi:hypothetical protein
MVSGRWDKARWLGVCGFGCGTKLSGGYFKRDTQIVIKRRFLSQV